MDKRADGRNRRGQDEWADGRTGGRAERQTKQTERRNGQNGRSGRIGGQMGGRSGGRSGRKGKQSGRTAETPHRHSEDSQNAGLNHAAGEEKTTIRPGKTGRKRKPGAETGSRADGSGSDGSGSDGSGSDGSGSAKKTIRNQRTIISVCPSALTLCDARQ